MTNDEFILGLLELKVKRGYIGQNGGFLFEYDSSTLLLSSKISIFEKNYFFYFIGENKKYEISEEVYNQAEKYFYGTDYNNLKSKLVKDLRKIKLNNINDL